MVMPNGLPVAGPPPNLDLNPGRRIGIGVAPPEPEVNNDDKWLETLNRALTIAERFMDGYGQGLLKRKGKAAEEETGPQWWQLGSDGQVNRSLEPPLGWNGRQQQPPVYRPPAIIDVPPEGAVQEGTEMPEGSVVVTKDKLIEGLDAWGEMLAGMVGGMTVKEGVALLKENKDAVADHVLEALAHGNAEPGQ